MDTLTRTFTDELEATQYWAQMAGEYRVGLQGTYLAVFGAPERRVVSNDIEYTKEGTFVVTTVLAEAK